MKLAISPPQSNSRMLGALDTVFCLLGIPLSVWCAYELSLALRKEEPWSAGAIFIGTIVVFMLAVSIGGFYALFARVQVSSAGISYRSWRRHTISWESITRLRFYTTGSFTPWLSVRTRCGKTYTIPVAADELKGFFHPLSGYEEALDQSLQPTAPNGRASS
jgi:hypothetical protein